MYRPNSSSGRPVYLGSQSFTIASFVFTAPGPRPDPFAGRGPASATSRVSSPSRTPSGRRRRASGPVKEVIVPTFPMTQVDPTSAGRAESEEAGDLGDRGGAGRAELVDHQRGGGHRQLHRLEGGGPGGERGGEVRGHRV